MNEKIIFFAAIIILTVFSFSGCSADNSKGVSQNKKNTQVMQSLDETISSSMEKKTRTANEDLMEMRQWKHEVNGPADNQSDTPAAGNLEAVCLSSGSTDTPGQLSASFQEEVVSIQLLNQDEMDTVINKLNNLGYLGSTAVSESEFKDALEKFQRDNKLVVSGVLDSLTLSILKTK